MLATIVRVGLFTFPPPQLQQMEPCFMSESSRNELSSIPNRQRLITVRSVAGDAGNSALTAKLAAPAARRPTWFMRRLALFSRASAPERKSHYPFCCARSSLAALRNFERL